MIANVPFFTGNSSILMTRREDAMELVVMDASSGSDSSSSCCQRYLYKWTWLSSLKVSCNMEFVWRGMHAVIRCAVGGIVRCRHAWIQSRNKGTVNSKWLDGWIMMRTAPPHARHGGSSYWMSRSMNRVVHQNVNNNINSISGSQFEFWWFFWPGNWHFFSQSNPCILNQIDPPFWCFFWEKFWCQLIHTIPEDGAAYGVHAALTQSFNMCLSMEEFQFWHMLGFPWGSSGRAPKKCCMKKANLFAC